ncbi:MAG TPA: serine/threonine-protein kinase [Gemmatimonadaceae bacterium]
MVDTRELLQKHLGDTLVLVKELGEGGMSRVYLARDRSLGRPVVLKVLAPELAGTLNAERFRREMLVAARLQHSHIVPVLTTGETGDAGEFLYYTMPYMEGETLRERLSREGALPVGDVVIILRDVLDALAYAHRRGVVHRDIKPENILLCEGGALVADFGIAKAVTDAGAFTAITGTGIVVGTPGYTAPEQAAADPGLDHRADLYACGAVAYEMLSGAPVFAHHPPHRQFAAHAIEAPIPLGQKRAGVPPLLSELVMACLEKDPGRRPSTADAVLRDLDGIATARGRIRSSAMAIMKLRPRWVDAVAAKFVSAFRQPPR